MVLDLKSLNKSQQVWTIVTIPYSYVYNKIMPVTTT